jgi:hypothetical protein
MVFFVSTERYRVDTQCFRSPHRFSQSIEDIRARYRTPDPTVVLNESFLEQFGVEHEDFETLMEDWFYDEEWLVKKGERNVLHNTSRSLIGC